MYMARVDGPRGGKVVCVLSGLRSTSGLKYPTHTYIYIYVYTRRIFNSVTDLLDTGAIPKINPHNYARV